jgi:assimilatory nitrate reductase catalytic subunit
MVLSARGSEQHSHGVDNVLAFINLVLALGKAGKPHCGYGCLTGQGNGQGGREHGQKSDQLPGYRRLDNPEHRTAIAQIWGVDPDKLPAPGKSACELLDALGLDGGVHALLVFASNIVVSAPRAATLPKRLQALDLLVVVDSFLSETAALADVVLPTTQWAEEDGTMTNLEGRVILRRAARPPPEGVRTDTQILKLLAHRLGCVDGFDDAAPLIFEELRRASAGGIADYAGISYQRIEAEQGVFWPCPSVRHTGTPRMFLDRFATVDGRARFHPVEYRGAAEEPDDDYPFYLTTGRLMNHYQTGAQTRRIPELAAAEPGPYVEMHPQVARTLGVDEGGLVHLRTRRGELLLPARMAAGIRLDTLFVPFHWGGMGSINRLTNQALDPISKIPEFKVCAARIDRPPPPSAATIHLQDG